MLAIGFTVFSHLAWSGVVVAGQTIGKSGWSDRSKLSAKRYQAQEISTAYTRGQVLSLRGSVVGNINGTALFFYDEKKMLAAARISTEFPEDLLKKLAKVSHAKLQKDSSYRLKDLRLRIETDGSERSVVISTSAFDYQYAEDIEASNKSKSEAWQVAAIGATLFLALLFFSGLIWTPQKREIGNSISPQSPPRKFEKETQLGMSGTAAVLGVQAACIGSSQYCTSDDNHSSSSLASSSFVDSPSDTYENHFDSWQCDVNPANGLPMCGAVDAYGNSYGTNFNDPW